MTNNDARAHFLADDFLRQQLISDLRLEILEILPGLGDFFSRVSMSGNLYC